MDEKIEKLIKNLDWNLPVEIKNKAINELLNLDEDNIEFLIQPFGLKNYWENAAMVISKIGYPKNRLAIPGLLEWLQDINWPGAPIAMECLQNIDAQVLLPYIESTVVKAAIDNDDMWLISLKELVVNRLSIDVDKFKNKDLYKIIEQTEG